MIHDIYNKLATDANFVPQLEHSDEVESIVQQIKMVLGTKPGDVLGFPDFGIDLNQYIFNLGYNQELIKSRVAQAISGQIQYDSNKYTVEVDVKFGKEKSGTSDYALVDIIINQRRCLGVVVSQ